MIAIVPALKLDTHNLVQHSGGLLQKSSPLVVRGADDVKVAQRFIAGVRLGVIESVRNADG
jgi:hypothetical protein